MQVCVLGNGQLGRMLRQAGEPLGIKVWPVGIDEAPGSVPIEQSVITAEIERWPDTGLTRQLAQHPRFANQHIIPRLADRLTQKQLLDELDLPVAPWQPLDCAAQWVELFETYGERLIVKRRTGGYDGRGQWRLTTTQLNSFPKEGYGECIVEQSIDFNGEVSLIGARNHAGKQVFYPLTRNLHQDGILLCSIARPKQNNPHQQQAEAMLSAIMEKLEYVGVMAMECFITAEGLMINELAPRVHNSGHWTQNGSSISQFELHLRAILDLPLPDPVVKDPSVMINLIGCPLDYQWLSHALVNLHWYDKQVRPGRKLGHINLSHGQKHELIETLKDLAPQLPNHYISAISWAIAQL